MECGRGRVIRSAAFVIVSPTPGVFADHDHAKVRSKITCAISLVKQLNTQTLTIPAVIDSIDPELVGPLRYWLQPAE